MKDEKLRRIVNRKLLDTYHKMSCAAGAPHMGDVVGHHIKSKGSGGDDNPSNLMPLCWWHHAEIHSLGNRKMLLKYPQLREYLHHGEEF